MWLLFASLNPVSESLKGVFSKRASKEVDPVLISWFNNIVPALFYFPLLFFIEINWEPDFIAGVLVSGSINIVTAILYHKALKYGDISKVVPMLSFTPLFLLLTAPLITGEKPGILGLLGVILIVVGSYLLNIKGKNGGIFSPFKEVVKNKGSRYMLIISFLWSFSSVFDKLAINSVSIWQYIAIINLYISAGLTVYAISKGVLKLDEIKKQKMNLMAVGLFTTLSFFFHFKALSLNFAAYTIAMKRTTGLISVILGKIFFGEAGIRGRFFAALIMFLGVILIIFSM